MRVNIDSVTIHRNRFFGWGWVLAELPVAKAALHVHYAHKLTDVFPCTIGLGRPDVGQAFPEFAHGSNAGLMFYGVTRAGLQIQQVTLHAEFKDDSIYTTALPEFFNQADTVTFGLKRGGVRGWLGKGVRRLQSLFSAALPGPQPLFPPLSTQPVSLVFDHNMGGGANRYRQELVQRKLGAQQTVVLVHPKISALNYEFVTIDAAGQVVTEVAAQSTLLDLLQRLRIADITVNSLIGFEDPPAMLEWISAAKRKSGASLFFPWHDFHAVCPSWTLLDQQGRFCNIPDATRCATCLPNNPAMFHDITSGLTIGDWRQSWYSFLSACDDIHVFSESSRDLLFKAYPKLERKPVKLVPHDVGGLKPQKIEFARTARLTIGIVGAIGLHKGAEIVTRMAALIEAEKQDIGLVIIGTLESTSIPANITVTGPYKNDDLPALLLRHGVNVCLLPSIIPETFSYVTQEIMSLGMPLAVFGLGAPAERVKKYVYGRVISEISAEAALEGIGKLYQSARGATKLSP